MMLFPLCEFIHRLRKYRSTNRVDLHTSGQQSLSLKGRTVTLALDSQAHFVRTSSSHLLSRLQTTLMKHVTLCRFSFLRFPEEVFTDQWKPQEMLPGGNCPSPSSPRVDGNPGCTGMMKLTAINKSCFRLIKTLTDWNESGGGWGWGVMPPQHPLPELQFLLLSTASLQHVSGWSMKSSCPCVK